MAWGSRETIEHGGYREVVEYTRDDSGRTTSSIISRERISNESVEGGPIVDFIIKIWMYPLIISIFGLVLIEVLGPFFYVALGAGIILGVWRLAVSPRTLRARMFLRDAIVAVGGFFRAMVEEVRDRVTSIF